MVRLASPRPEFSSTGWEYFRWNLPRGVIFDESHEDLNRPRHCCPHFSNMAGAYFRFTLHISSHGERTFHNSHQPNFHFILPSHWVHQFPIILIQMPTCYSRSNRREDAGITPIRKRAKRENVILFQGGWLVKEILLPFWLYRVCHIYIFYRSDIPRYIISRAFVSAVANNISRKLLLL